MKQSVGYYLIALSHLFRRERNLFQIIFTLVRVVVGAVQGVFDGVLHCLGGRDRVTLLVSQLAGNLIQRDYGPVHALPVVNVLTPSP